MKERQAAQAVVEKTAKLRVPMLVQSSRYGTAFHQSDI